MTEPTTPRHSSMRIAIIVLAVALVATAVLVVFLLRARDASTALPVPTPTPSTSSATGEPSPTTSASDTPATTTPTSPAPQSASPEPSPSPRVTGTPATSAPGSTAPAVPDAGQTMMWEGRASFDHFSVAVLQDDPDQDTEMIEDKAGLPVEVCVIKGVDGTDGARISSESWTLEDADGNVQTPQQGGYEPAFPTETQVSAGECVRGFLTFDYVSAEGDSSNLVHENSLGDRAVWQFH